MVFRDLNVAKWPGRAKEDSRLLAEKLPFIELRNGKFRQPTQWLVLADSGYFSKFSRRISGFTITFGYQHKARQNQAGRTLQVAPTLGIAL
jgi:hypothetical protein